MKDFFIKLSSTFFFVGFNPVLPGTTTTLVNTVIIFLIFLWKKELSFFIIPVIAVFVTIIGFPISTEAERVFGEKDPGKITIDEVSGIFIAFSFISLNKVEYPVVFFISVFAVFRALDMAKPFFIRTIQRLKGGAGVMMDDVIAGLLTNILVRLGYLIAFREFV